MIKMATNFATATYTEVVDMQTVDGKLSVIGVHTPVGKSPYLKLKGFFTQFRKYRYDGISSLTICPASGLPIDPLGLSSIPGSTDQMDPRDTFNPILFKGCHGEHLHKILNDLMNDREYVTGGLSSAGFSAAGVNRDSTGGESAASLRKKEIEMTALSAAEHAYYSWLTDTTWRKFGIQSVIKLRHLKPLVWKVARNMPLLPASTGTVFNTNAGELRRESGTTANTLIDPSTDLELYGDSRITDAIGKVPSMNDENAYVQEFTNGVARLGWLPTTVQVQGDARPMISALPKLFMGVLCLPPSYSVEQFMRAVIVHHFSFKDFSTSVAAMDPNVVEPAYNSLVDSQGYMDEVPYSNWIDYATSKGATLDVFNGSSELVSDGVA